MSKQANTTTTLRVVLLVTLTVPPSDVAWLTERTLGEIASDATPGVSVVVAEVAEVPAA